MAGGEEKILVKIQANWKIYFQSAAAGFSHAVALLFALFTFY
jgi:hypothetical protein